MTPAARIGILTMVMAALAPARTAPAQPTLVRPGNEVSDAASPVTVPPALPTVDEVLNVEVSGEVRQLAAALADRSYHRREEAMRTLLETPVAVSELCSMLARDDLSMEQRFRLLDILQHRLDEEPRGAVGIRMQWTEAMRGEPAGVEVSGLIPGLPAERSLVVGDLIVQVDGTKLLFAADLLVLVQTKHPGDEVTLKIRRTRRDERGDIVTDDEGVKVKDTIDLTLHLGSARQLVDPDTGRRTDGGTVWQTRHREVRAARQRYGPRPRPVEVEGGDDGLFVPSPVTSADSVENHKMIRDLRLQLELIDDNLAAMTAERREEWRRTLRSLVAQARQPGIPDDERRFLQQLARRFAELMQGP